MSQQTRTASETKDTRPRTESGMEQGQKLRNEVRLKPGKDREIKLRIRTDKEMKTVPEVVLRGKSPTE
jgi:hypothetical protein